MYKKIISVMSVILVVFLCINYGVKADEIIDSSRRYNWLSTTQHYGNVDVTGNLFCLSDNPAMQSVNLSSAEYVGGGTTQSVVSTWESVYLWKFQATYVLKNNGDTYETFDNGRLYSQFSVTAKASTSSSPSGSLSDDIVPSGWYIDNIQGATLTNALSDGTMYWSVDDTYYGNTLIIAPGQSITFSYDINIFWWEQSFGVGGTSFSCQNGSISNTIGYTQNGGYNSYSVYEFITTNQFPSINQYIASNINDIWTNTQTLVSQGVVDQSIFNNIVSILSSYSSSINYSSTGAFNKFNYASKTVNNVRFSASYVTTGAELADSDVDYQFSNSNIRNLYKLKRTYIITINNNNDYTVQLPWRFHVYITDGITSNYSYLGYYYDFQSDGLIPNTVAFRNLDAQLYVTDLSRNPITISPNTTISLTIQCNYYYGSATNDQINFTWSNDTFTFDDFTVTQVTDPNDALHQTENSVHQQEQSWFNQGNQSIGDTGIENYQFNTEQSGGISGVSNDFVRVWNACGSLNSVWIFSLTLSLALYIIHHVPKQRS